MTGKFGKNEELKKVDKCLNSDDYPTIDASSSGCHPLPLVKVVLVKWPGYETVVKGVFILSEMIKDQYIHLGK